MDAVPRWRAGALWMGRAVLTAAIAFGAAEAVAAAPPGERLLGREAPDFTLKSTAGQNLRLSEFRGQVVLINFWARWAGDSRQEIPALERIHGTYARAGLVVLGVSIEADPRRAGEFAAAMHIPYPVLIDTDPELGRKFAVDKMPMTILLDRAGIVRYAHVGFQSADEAVYLDQIRALLRD
ncbi:MAG: peroxiredoxin family protein [Steroidobacterales bacterium]